MSDRYIEIGSNPSPYMSPEEVQREADRKVAMSPALAAPYGGTQVLVGSRPETFPRQTRAAFDPEIVIRGLEQNKEPVQGWVSLAQEAACRIIELETAIVAVSTRTEQVMTLCSQATQPRQEKQPRW